MDCKTKSAYIRERCPDFCYNTRCGGNSCSTYTKICKCNKKVRQKEKQWNIDQDCLSILSKDYNSNQYINDRSYYNVYNLKLNTGYKPTSNSKKIFKTGEIYHKIINYNKINEIRNNKYKIPYEVGTPEYNYYIKIYNQVYNSFYRRLVPHFDYISNAKMIANRKAIDWIRKYASSQGTTNNGWPAISLNGY